MKENTPTEAHTSKKTPSNKSPIHFDKKFWNAEKIISLSAFVTSIATLLALMYQISLSGEQNELARKQQELVQKQQYASVLPYLELSIRTNSGDRLFEFILVNNGVGPAFIEEIRTIYDGQIYPGGPPTFYRAVIVQKDYTIVGTQNINKGQVIPAGEKIAMLTAFADASSSKDRDRLIKWFGRPTQEPELARVEVVYSSVYGERWVIKGMGAIPESLVDEEGE